MSPIKSVLITGANAGLGREAARQLAAISSIEKVYLACRNEAKAHAAKAALAAEAKRDIFKIVLMDVMEPASVRRAVSQITAPIDALVLNAGGLGGKSSNTLTPHGVTSIFAVNLLGHAVLVEEMLERQLITSTVLYAGSEAARGIPKMGVARPALKAASVDEFRAMVDGRRFTEQSDPMETYAAIKLIAALWMSSMARQQPHLRFVTMSPGGTTGTSGFDDMPFLKRLFFKHVGGVLMPLLGMMHGIEDGAKRYVDGLMNPKFKSGVFYASAGEAAVGRLVDQGTLYAALNDPEYQDKAAQAIHQLI